MSQLRACPNRSKVLVKELQSLCLDVKILGEDGEEVDLKGRRR